MTYLYITAGTILFFAIAGQILKGYFRGEVVWTIKKGNHYTSFWLRTLTWIMWIGCWNFSAKQMSYTVAWGKSAVYTLPGSDQKDWNKLPGFQRRFDKTNRALKAWRYVVDTVETASYYHDNSSEENIIFPKPAYWNEHQKIWMKSFKADTFPFGNAVVNTFGTWVTPLFPYFGGNQVAPHDTHITITNMEVR